MYTVDCMLPNINKRQIDADYSDKKFITFDFYFYFPGYLLHDKITETFWIWETAQSLTLLANPVWWLRFPISTIVNFTSGNFHFIDEIRNDRLFPSHQYQLTDVLSDLFDYCLARAKCALSINFGFVYFSVHPWSVSFFNAHTIGTFKKKYFSRKCLPIV